MCRHCRRLALAGAECPFPALAEVLALVQLGNKSPELPEDSADATTDSYTTDSTPSVLEACAEHDPPADTAPCRAQVPYLPNGLIDWDLLADLDDPIDEEDDKFVLEISRIEGSPARLHPYNHNPEDDEDCYITGHICNCDCCKKVEDLSSPARKRARTQAGAIDEFLNSPTPTQHGLREEHPPDKDEEQQPPSPPPQCPGQFGPPPQPLEPPGSAPPVGALTPPVDPMLATGGEETIETPVENYEATNGKRRRLSSKSTPSADTAAGSADPVAITPEPTSNGNGNENAMANAAPTANAAAMARNDGDNDEDQPIQGPFKLISRWQPKDKAQCYLMGTVAGAPNKFVTNITVRMSEYFKEHMDTILSEAEAGRLRTKKDAVTRRDELTGRAEAEAAEPTPEVHDEAVDVN